MRRTVSSHRCVKVESVKGPLVLVHRLVLFFSNVYRFPDPPVHSVAFSVDQLGVVPDYDVVVRDGVICNC